MEQWLGLARGHRGVTGLDLAGRKLVNRGVRVGVGDHEHRGGLLAGLLDGAKVGLHEDVAALHVVAHLGEGREGLALKLDSVDANVDEDLCTSVGEQAKGVSGLGDYGHGAVDRRDDLAIRGLDRDALAHGERRKDRV